MAPPVRPSRRKETVKRTRAQKFLMYINMFTALVGLMFLFASFYARGQVTGSGWSSVVASNVAWVGVFASMLTILVSFIGCFAAQTGHRSILLCYLAAFTFILGCQIAAAVTMSNYANQLSITNPNAPSGSLTLYGDVEINNAVYSTYQMCCSGCPNQVCNNTFPGAYVNYTLPYCINNVTATLPPTCTLVDGACASPIQDLCFQFIPSYDYPVIIPPNVIDSSLCRALTSLNFNGGPLVGPFSNGVSCGAGNPKKFLANLAAYVKSSLYGVAVVYIIIAFFEALILPAGVYVLCCLPKGGGLIKGEDEIEIV